VNDEKKILITGTTGMLGKQFQRFLKDKYKNIYTLNRKDGNLLDFNFVKAKISLIKPDLIIHCIADTNLTRCENEQEQTLLLHCGLTHCLSSGDSKVIYISTSSVINPHNFYDKTKLLGEKICLLNNKKNMVVRTNIYGHNSSSGNSLFEWSYKNFSNKKQITGFHDVYFNAVYTKQLVRSVFELIQRNCEGIINVAGNYSVSKYEFLEKVCETFEFNKNLLRKEKMPINKKIKRNKNTVLDVLELKNKYKISLCLQEGLKELKKDLE
jgi:dTDP-4-dehydrorhamnose reductase|tara:strand:+ start:80 stop:883 length:804 start_codon:yes stop_codon:yes gene_type:complete